MSSPRTAAERVRFYLEQADAAEANGDRCPDAITAEAFRKVADQWRALAAQQERRTPA